MAFIVTDRSISKQFHEVSRHLVDILQRIGDPGGGLSCTRCQLVRLAGLLRFSTILCSSPGNHGVARVNLSLLLPVLLHFRSRQSDPDGFSEIQKLTIGITGHSP